MDKNKKKDYSSQTMPEQKEVFNSIEEYESHLNDNIKDSLSVFVNVTNNTDILFDFLKMSTKELDEKNR